MKFRTVLGRWTPLEKQKHETKIRRCTGAMRCQQLSQNLGSFFGDFFFPFSFGIPWRRSARRVRAELMLFGALASLEIYRELSQRNLHLPWGFTASQQRLGKRSRLKDSSSWRQRKEEKKTNMEWTKWRHSRTKHELWFSPISLLPGAGKW